MSAAKHWIGAKMKREKTKLELMGEELVTLAKCIEYFKKRGKDHVTASLRKELIPIIEYAGYKVDVDSDNDLVIRWND